ncbi:protein FLX-like 3 isoform X2 [Olea europaea var. sylvestris]|uniref:protein FLX-like 3 isoform X2 n=1 Tax=Olea europaea var. sylvestris TaxID=158386 RepID=UPI000C1CE995|nr:protein FLX-like 3 isoform X2 [Olea europaea var. sylvestris]
MRTIIHLHFIFFCVHISHVQLGICNTGLRSCKKGVSSDKSALPAGEQEFKELGFFFTVIYPFCSDKSCSLQWFHYIQLLLTANHTQRFFVMAGRNHMSRHPDNFRVVRDGPHSYLDRGPGPVPSHPVALEEELELQHRDIKRLLAENRHVLDDNVMLQRELTAVKDEIHGIGQVIPKLRADREIQTRELIDRGLKLEAELRSVEPLRGEVKILRDEAQKLSTLRQDLSSQVQTLTKDINRMQAESQQIAAMKTDIDKMGKELVDARRMYEYEKKGNEELVEQNRSMEKNLLSMAREIEKLRAEQASVERRARGVHVSWTSLSFLQELGVTM